MRQRTRFIFFFQTFSLLLWKQSLESRVVRRIKMAVWCFDLLTSSGIGWFPLIVQLRSHLGLLWLMYCSIVSKRLLVRDGTSSQTPFTSVRVRASMTFSWASSMGITPWLRAWSTPVESLSFQFCDIKRHMFICYLTKYEIQQRKTT